MKSEGKTIDKNRINEQYKTKLITKNMYKTKTYTNEM